MPESRPPMFDSRDALGVIGLGLLAGGCWMVYPPAALVLPGLVLIGVAIFGVRR